MSKEFQVAAYRALGTSFITGALSFFAIWSQTDDVKTLVIGTMVPVLTGLAARFGVEGYVDTVAAKK
jgi:hypothetical protein